MIVIEKLKEHPVDNKPCYLTLFAEGGVIQHLEDKSVILGKWKVLKTHGWQTGTPTEEGVYLVYMDKFCPRYSILWWDRDVMWGLPNPDLVIAWQRIEPYTEASE